MNRSFRRSSNPFANREVIRRRRNAGGSSAGHSSLMPGIVACTNCSREIRGRRKILRSLRKYAFYFNQRGRNPAIGQLSALSDTSARRFKILRSLRNEL